jgi:hypothetical protein
MLDSLKGIVISSPCLFKPEDGWKTFSKHIVINDLIPKEYLFNITGLKYQVIKLFDMNHIITYGDRGYKDLQYSRSVCEPSQPVILRRGTVQN